MDKSDFLKTEAGKFLSDNGFDLIARQYFNVLGRVFKGYYKVYGMQEFDGSLRQLAEIACGRRLVTNFGHKGREALTYLWFRQFGILNDDQS